MEVEGLPGQYRSMTAGRFSLFFRHVTAEHVPCPFGDRYPWAKPEVTWQASTDWSATGTLEEHLLLQSPPFGGLTGKPKIADQTV